ncbi:MAG: hypothetical protein HY287_06010 [Planctomycetes bacterium]|nr:hypothetical protein [Planctomycetota bacterium]MBI3833867.1 hypothetical protein [Planctomycetota bacterium]
MKFPLWGIVAVSTLIPVGAVTAKPVDCAACHADRHKELAGSVHSTLHCQECHGGSDSYVVEGELPKSDGGAKFDHGSSFKGHVERRDIPQLCGECHTDVARMNPYGLRTDQLAAYWTSAHGKALKEKGETRVAVCTDCHGDHAIQRPSEPTSKTNPLNVPDTCGHCHADAKLMSEFKIPSEIVAEYRQSVHGELLLQKHDRGAPTCATCHGNHAATPPGFANVGSVCGQCHQHAATNFAKSIHADREGFHGCVQCHGGGPDAHFHKIEKITEPAAELVQDYARLVTDQRYPPSPSEVAARLHATPKQIVQRALPGCSECHDSLEKDESLQKFFHLLDTITDGERKYVGTAEHLNRVGRGILLVDSQRFRLEEATTHLIALAPLQHTLDQEALTKKLGEMNAVCDEVDGDLVQLEKGLQLRTQALAPIWAFVLIFVALLYTKYKRLRKEYVATAPGKEH